MRNIHKILIITTGGTFTGNTAKNENKFENFQVSDDIISSTSPLISYLNKIYSIEIILEIYEYCDEDSSNFSSKQWSELALRIKENYDDYNSFIIVHGTNTLGYTSAALTFALANLNKPVILTGSQVPIGIPSSDAFGNLFNAIRLAVFKPINPIIGVITVFGSQIISGTRVKKETEFEFDAFKSFGVGSLGKIGRIISINEKNLAKHISYLSTNLYQKARTVNNLRFENDFDTRIVSLTEFPGMSPDIFESLINNNDIRGIILRSFGGGDINRNLFPTFEYLKEREIPIVVTTQVPNGNSNFQINETGQYLRKNLLAIPAYDMSIEAQTVKLSWLIAKRSKGYLNYLQLCQEMINDLRDELNVIWEVGY